MAINLNRAINIIIPELNARIDALLPTIGMSTAPYTLSEGNSGTTNFNFTVTRTNALTRLDLVNYTVAGTGSNPAGASDFVGGTFPTGSVIFGIGETSKTITIPVQGDTTAESGESFTVTITLPGIGTLLNATATGTIGDDDTVSVSAPVNTVAPTISGSTTTGSTLTVSNGTWSNSPTSYAYQWIVAGADVSGATAATYVIATGDVGKAITCRVRATNAGGNASVVTSNSITAVAPVTSSIPDVGVPPSSATISGVEFAPFNTTSTAHTFFYNYRSSSIKVLLSRSDNAQLYPPVDAIEVSFGAAAWGVSRWVNGVSSVTNMSNISYTPPPQDTPVALTLNVDHSITFVRTDTNATLFTIPKSGIEGFFGTNLTGTFVSFHGNVPGTYLGAAMTGLRAQGNAVPLTITSYTMDQSFRPTIIANYTGTNKTGYRLEKRFWTSGAAGDAIGSKVDAVVTVPSAGNLSLTAPINFDSGQYSEKVIVRVYELVNGVESGVFRDTLPYTMPASALVPMTMGVNYAGANYYSPTPMASDMGKHSTIKDEYKCILFPYAFIDGTYDVEITPGTVITGGYNGFESRAVSVTTVNQAAGTYTIVVNGDNNPAVSGQGGNARGIAYTGTKPTFFRMKLRGEASDINPRWVSNAFGKGMRDLDICSANYTPTDNSWFSTATWDDNLSLPLKAFAKKHAVDPNFTMYHHCQIMTADDSVVTRNAQMVRDYFPNNSTAKFIFEFSNETWNDAFAARTRAMQEAAKEGFIDGTYAARGTKYVIKQPYQFTPDPINAPDTKVWRCQAMNAGEAFIGNNIASGFGSYHLLVAKVAIPAGSEAINATNFASATDLTTLIRRARCWEAFRRDQCIDIYRSVLGDERFNRQVLPGVYGQQGGNPAQFFDESLNFVPGHRAKIKIVGIGAYVFNSNAIVTATSGLTKQIVAQNFIDNIPNTKAELAAWAAGVREMGNFQTGIYEGGAHPSFYYGGDNEYLHYKSIWNGTDAGHHVDGLNASSLMGAFDYDWAKMVSETITGYCFYYQAFGSIWGLKWDWGTTTPRYRLDGHNAGLTGGARPAFA